MAQLVATYEPDKPKESSNMIAKMAIVQTANTHGTDISVRVHGETVDLKSVKNATGRQIVKGQRVLIHYREGALTASDPAYITSILDGAVD